MQHMPDYTLKHTYKAYLLQFEGKTWEFRTQRDYYDYITEMNSRKKKIYPKLPAERRLNLYLLETDGRNLIELEAEDELMRCESY